MRRDAYVFVVNTNGLEAEVGIYDGLHDGSNATILGIVNIPPGVHVEDEYILKINCDVDSNNDVRDLQFISIAPDKADTDCGIDQFEEIPTL